jgi:predicted Zn-dependent protease
VISHELSHILLSHITKTQIRRTGLSFLDSLFLRKVGDNSILGMASKLGINLIDLKSSRGYEYQADDLGVKLMTQAGYDPQAALKVFAILKANTPTSGTPGFLMDHPITEDRIQALVKKYKLSLN